MGAGQLAPGQERVPGLSWRDVRSVQDVLALLKGGLILLASPWVVAAQNTC
jgi:hypothetical protein